MDQKQDEKQATITPAGVVPEKTDEQKLIDIIRNTSTANLKKMNEEKRDPAVFKRHTMADRLRTDPTAVTLHQMASASYDAELNKYNVRYQPATMA
jgi:hypothetical protein